MDNINMDNLTEEQKQQLKNKQRSGKKVQFKGIDIEKLLEMSQAEQMEKCFLSRQRRKFARGVNRGPAALLRKLRQAKKETAFGEKPAAVKTHLRNMVIVPEMLGSIVGIYNGKQFINAEVKPEMIGTYLAEYSITYKPIRHGRPGLGATANRFIPG